MALREVASTAAELTPCDSSVEGEWVLCTTVLLELHSPSEPPGGFLKARLLGRQHLQGFRFSSPQVGPKDLIFQQVQVLLMLLVWGPHFENHRCVLEGCARGKAHGYLGT